MDTLVEGHMMPRQCMKSSSCESSLHFVNPNFNYTTKERNTNLFVKSHFLSPTVVEMNKIVVFMYYFVVN